MTSLAVYLFGYRLDKILYPWRESIVSALDLTWPNGAVFFCACDDETLAAAIELANRNDRLRLFRHPWADDYYGDPERVKMEGYKIQAVIGNFLLDAIGAEFEWVLKLDADEVIHDQSINLFRSWLKDANKNEEIKLARPYYTHICPDDRHEFDFIYRSKAVLSRTSAGLRYTQDRGGDACALGGAPETQTPLEIWHYGKLHQGRRREALEKEIDFTRLYEDLGFPDPKVTALKEGDGYMDYTRVFDAAIAEGTFRNIVGRHPVYIEYWLQQMRAREEVFWNERQRQTA